eukprot:12566384-Prorocentrum_lima.AAC.1
MVAGWTKGDFHQTTAVLHSRTGLPCVAAIISKMRLMFTLPSKPSYCWMMDTVGGSLHCAQTS